LGHGPVRSTGPHGIQFGPVQSTDPHGTVLGEERIGPPLNQTMVEDRSDTDLDPFSPVRSASTNRSEMD
jgi:hypothetical protein